MNTFEKMGRALRVGLGVGLFAALGSLSGCMSAGEAEAPEDESVGQAEEAITVRYKCTMASGKPAHLVVYDNNTCKRFLGNVPGAAGDFCSGGAGCESCWTVARDFLACELLN